MEIPLYDICCFSLVECNTFFLSIIFVSWFFCVLAWFFLFFSCMGFSAILWLEWVFYFPQYEVFCYYLFNIFSFLFRINIMWISISLILSQSSLRLLQFCLIIFLLLFPPTHSFFSLFSSAAVISTTFSSSSLICSSASFILLFLLLHFSFHLLCCSFVCSSNLLAVF